MNLSSSMVRLLVPQRCVLSGAVLVGIFVTMGALPAWGQEPPTAGLFAPPPGAGEASAPPIVPLDSNAVLRQANADLRAERWAEAAKGYAALLAEGRDSADIHYNLGVIHIKLENLGRAILHLERALRRDPGHEDARFNLEWARKQRKDEVVMAQAGRLAQGGFDADAVLAAVPVSFWATLLLIIQSFGIAALVMVIVFRWGRWRLPHWIFPAGIVAVLLAALILPVYERAVTLSAAVREGVIVVEEATVREGPHPKHKALFTVHAGLKARVDGRVEDYVRIRLPNGLVGFVAAHEVEGI